MKETEFQDSAPLVIGQYCSPFLKAAKAMGRSTKFRLINPLDHRTRNVTIGGNRTSIRLEQQFWSGLEEIATREGLSVNVLVSRIRASQRGDGSLSSAVRVFIQAYFFALAHNRRPVVPKGYV
ncbi:ribbon-helix-helix domain-containing protein [Inquilinus limosus]|uniref:ribbon-helix-helix domain-containing protein n=1 Tax=Inquilinus limosus TaxID=171674 RepID=UPI003F5CD16C